jgi:hypothetical protein
VCEGRHDLWIPIESARRVCAQQSVCDHWRDAPLPSEIAQLIGLRFQCTVTARLCMVRDPEQLYLVAA